MLSVLSLFILFPVVFSVMFCASFAYMHALYHIVFPLFTVHFFYCCIIKKVRGWRKLTFQTTAFRKVIRAKILF